MTLILRNVFRLVYIDLVMYHLEKAEVKQNTL